MHIETKWRITLNTGEGTFDKQMIESLIEAITDNGNKCLPESIRGTNYGEWIYFTNRPINTEVIMELTDKSFIGISCDNIEGYIKTFVNNIKDHRGTVKERLRRKGYIK